MNPSHIRQMAHSPIYNYIVPGLTSWLIGQPGPLGCVRLFHSERDQLEAIVPHSHRFDFQCHVLYGEVVNLIYGQDEQGDEFQESVLLYKGKPGEYVKVVGDRSRWSAYPRVYKAGYSYGMKHDEVQSIRFGRGAMVLFMEGPTLTDTTVVLEPVVNGVVVPTFEVKDWMFGRQA